MKRYFCGSGLMAAMRHLVWPGIVVVLLIIGFCAPGIADKIGTLVEEEDGSPSSYAVKLKFGNGTLTDNGDGTASIANISSVTVQDEDGTPAVSATGIKFNNGTVTDNGDGTASVSLVEPGGSANQVQYMIDATTFGGDAGMTYTPTTDTLNIQSGSNSISISPTHIQKSGAAGDHMYFDAQGQNYVFNDDGDDSDFRVEGDTNANLLYIDAGNDKIGIGNSSPAQHLEVGSDPTDGNVEINGSLWAGVLELTEDGGKAGPIINMPVSGTPAADTEQSYPFAIDGTNILTIYSKADGDGEIYSPAVHLHGLDVDEAQTVTIPDSGDGAAATYTLTPTRSYVEVTCADANGCVLTMGENGIDEGTKTELANAGANPYTIQDTAGVSEMEGDFTAGQYDLISFRDMGDRWLERFRKNN